MKTSIIGLFLLLTTTFAQAQTRAKSPAKTTTTKQVAKKVVTYKKNKAPNNTMTYKSTSMNAAKRPLLHSAPRSTSFTIADPTINAFQLKTATNGNYPLTNRQIIALPRGSYGIANGRITLIPQGARTSGSFTGSGSVGTGTSTGVLGTTGPAMNVNGRHPYAGNNMYGLQASKEKLLAVPVNDNTNSSSGQ